MIFVSCVYCIYNFRYNDYSKNNRREWLKCTELQFVMMKKNVRDEIRNLILEWNSEVELKVFSSGEDLLENYLPYDAVFLDIDMQGMNGIETGKALRLIDLEVKIVYVTAYRDYVAGAFGVHAFQYLLKPVNRREIINILEEIFRYMEISDKKIILDFHTVDGIVCLPVESIYFF